MHSKDIKDAAASGHDTLFCNIQAGVISDTCFDGMFIRLVVKIKTLEICPCWRKINYCRPPLTALSVQKMGLVGSLFRFTQHVHCYDFTSAPCVRCTEVGENKVFCNFFFSFFCSLEPVTQMDNRAHWTQGTPNTSHLVSHKQRPCSYWLTYL